MNNFIFENHSQLELKIVLWLSLHCTYQNYLIYKINNKLQNKVKLIGYKENPMPYIKLADVFVLSSTFEGLPNVLIEALYLKKYIISSNCPSGPKEILNAGKYGSLFKVGDDHQLFQILKKFNHNKKINYKIEQGYKSLKRFNYKINCEKYYKLILNYLN